MTLPPRTPRLIAWLLLGSVVLLSSGCVYLRLLLLKNQLASFDRHFVIDTSDGVRVTCKDPVLTDEDLRWLGIEPQIITRQGEREHWYVHWVKDAPAGAPEASVYDVELEADLVDGRLRSARIPERFFEYVSKDLFVSMLRSTGAARIDRSKRRAEVSTGGAAAAPSNRPRLASVEGMLGRPTERSVSAEGVRCRYQYRPVTQSGGRGKPINVTFVFDPSTGELRRLIGKLPKGTVNYVLSGSNPK